MLLVRIQWLFVSLVRRLTPIAKARKVVIVGTGNSAKTLFNFFNSPFNAGYEFKGFFVENHEKNAPNPYIQGSLSDLKIYCLHEKIDEIYFTLSLTHEDLLEDLSDFADKNFIYFRLAPNVRELPTEIEPLASYFIDEIPVITLRKEPLSSRLNQTWKRGFDIVFSGLALLFLGIFVFPFIALAIRLESKGPIFFKQKRPGLKNQLFSCYKFRSMTVNNSGEQQATKNDNRITKVGAFLRKTSLDELPQFFNVLRGDMAVVGPRPNMVSQLETYSQLIDNYAFRHFVKPGITGWAQVNGFRGETQTTDLMEKRVQFDLEYMQRWSLGFDCKIIFLTVRNIIKGEENAY